MPKTVFIVGAGASSEFGFPLGTSLVTDLRNRLEAELGTDASGPRPIMDGSMELGHAGDWGDAARELAAGMVTARSIDRFLYTRSDKQLVVAMGKFAISHLIAEREKASVLSLQSGHCWEDTQGPLVATSNTWIGKLFSLLQEGKRPSEANTVFQDIAFVTFNYDRIIERYLHLAFQHTFRLDPNESESIVAGVPIEHVYGSLGALGGQSQSTRSFGLMYENPKDSIEHFVTFMEGVEDGRLTRLQSIIDEADLLVFLGFAFDKLNVDAICGPPFSRSRNVLATTYGMDSSSIDRARNSLCMSPASWKSQSSTCESLIGSELFNSTFFR